MERRRDVLHRIEHRQVVGAVLGRTVQRPVAIYRRLSLVGGNHVVKVMLLVAEPLQRDDDVALDALRTRGLAARQLTLRDASGPVAEHLRTERAERQQLSRHLLTRLARAHAPHPRRRRHGELAERLGDGARCLLHELVAADAGVVLHLVQPVGLLDVLRDLSLAAEVGGARNVQHREPVDAGVVLRRSGLIGSNRGGEVDQLSRRGRLLRTVDETIAARPHGVIGLRQIRKHEAAAVVGDDSLDIAHRQIARFRNHPDARLRSVGARHHAADVVTVDGDGRLLRPGGHEEERYEKRHAGEADGEFRLSGPRHHLVLRKSCIAWNCR